MAIKAATEVGSLQASDWTPLLQGSGKSMIDCSGGYLYLSVLDYVLVPLISTSTTSSFYFPCKNIHSIEVPVSFPH